MKKPEKKASKPAASPKALPTFRRWGWAFFFLLAWLWGSWWMGDVLRIAYERSFFAADATLMHWLWQQPYGTLWILGRALLTLYRWKVVGGLAVAAMLTAGSWLVGSSLRLPERWRWTQYVPAGVWMVWTAWSGLDLFYQHEPGRILGIPLLVVVVCVVMKTLPIKTHPRKTHPQPLPLGRGAVQLESKQNTSRQPSPLPNGRGWGWVFWGWVFFLFLFLLPSLLLPLRHPYLRPLTRMQVQLLEEDYEGMSATAHEHASMSYRPLAAYYAIALARTGHLTDQLFDIRLEFDTLRTHGYDGTPDQAMNYYVVDCNYHAGLIRPAMHRAMEELTMDGPSLFTLKSLTRMALIEHDWALARKYLHIIGKAPFEGAFTERYGAMLERPDLVSSDPEMASLMKTAPVEDNFENNFEKPCFLGYFAVVSAGRSMETLEQSLMANLYSKRMPDFLMRCQPLVGSTPPRSIAEGLVTQSPKNPAIIQAFPQLQMDEQRYVNFLRTVQPYMKDRTRGGEELFEQFKGYYPYYYFFGNLRATRKADDKKLETSKSGVN